MPNGTVDLMTMVTSCVGIIVVAIVFAAALTYSRLACPLGKEGVPTAIKTTSASLIILEISVVYLRCVACLRRSSRPSSRMGALPDLSISIFAGSISTPQTSWPIQASAAAVFRPT